MGCQHGSDIMCNLCPLGWPSPKPISLTLHPDRRLSQPTEPISIPRILFGKNKKEKHHNGGK